MLPGVSIPPTVRRPVGVQALTLRIRRGELTALHAGSPDDPTVVLVPGFTGSKEDFLPLLPALAEAGMHPLAYDQLGQYESAGTGRAQDYTLDRLAEDLLDVAASAAPVHAVGHSLGGLVVRQALLAQPDLFASLTLLDSGPGPLPRQYHDQLNALRQLVPIATLEQIWQLKEGLDREAEVPLPPPEVHRFLHRRWLANDARSLSGMAEILTTVPDRTGELAAALSEHGIPACVIYGVDDSTAWPVGEQEEMARRLDVPAIGIPEAAHSPAVENPARTVSELVAFLTSTHV